MELNSNEFSALENPIMNIKIQKFKTDVKDLGKINKKVEDKKNFKIIFKTLYEYLENFEKNFVTKLCKNVYKLESESNKSKKFIDDFIYEMIFNDLNIISKEVMTIFPENWKLLNYQNEKTKVHIIYALLFIFSEIKLNKISEYDANILLWAMLLHDIAKHVLLVKEANEDYSIQR
jgi:hypothetical protein